MSEEFWAAQDTSPTEIEQALRQLLAARHAETGYVAPARVLNLVAVVDGRFRGEVENRLERIGRFHPSRLVLCAVEPKRRTIDAWASMATPDTEPGELAISRERIEIEIGERHLRGLRTLVSPLVIPDLATLVWAPHGHIEALQALREIAQIVLIDSMTEPETDTALDRAAELARDSYVVDLSWLRGTPWRERVAAAFDSPQGRHGLRSISGVTVRHRHDSRAAAVLFCGWLGSRLEWRPERLVHRGETLIGRVRARRGEVQLTLDPVQQPGAPGLAGVTVETAAGETVSLDRSPGGLREVRRARDGTQREFTVLGASRGEAGILGEGVRQALLRDHTYRPALDAARAMVGR